MNLSFSTTDWLGFYSGFLQLSGTPNSAGWVPVKCPLHPDHHPSAGVNVQSGVFHCFVCGSLSPQRFLTEVLGVEAPTIVPSLPKVDEWASAPFPLGPRWEVFLTSAQKALSPDLPIVLDYEKTHGITFETLKAFGVGYVPESPDQLECLVLPYYVNGKLVALRGRSFAGLKGGVKGSHHTLYHLDSLEDSTQCVLVEGESDCLRAQQALRDRVPVVATPTAAFKREWARHLQGVDTVYVIPQADEPSQSQLVPQVIKALGESRVRVVQLPWKRGDLGKDLVDWLQSHDDSELIDLIPWETPKKDILTLQEMCQRADDPIPWVVEGLIALGDKVIVAGPQKGLKTFFVLNLARAISSGEDFLGWRVPTPRRALFIEEEGSPTAFAKRVKTVFTGTEGATIWWLHRSGVKLDQPEWKEKLSTIITEVNPAVIILDPLQRLHSKVEDASWEMGEVWDVVHSLARQDRAVIVVHHFSKRAKVQQGWDALRGSGRTAGEVDVGVFLEKSDIGVRLGLDGRDLPSHQEVTELAFDPVTFRFTFPGVNLMTTNINLTADLREWVPVKTLAEKHNLSPYRLMKLLEKHDVEYRGGLGRSPKEVKLRTEEP